MSVGIGGGGGGEPIEQRAEPFEVSFEEGESFYIEPNKSVIGFTAHFANTNSNETEILFYDGDNTDFANRKGGLFMVDTADNQLSHPPSGTIHGDTTVSYDAGSPNILITGWLVDV